MTVDATYVACTTRPTPIEELEPRHRNKVRYLNFIILYYRMTLAFNVIIAQKKLMDQK
jgi:hypothetical protein